MSTSNISATDLFSGAGELLKQGPIGLAGLLLVLVIIVLALRNVDGPRERLLRLFLYIGAFCFLAQSAFAFLPQYITAPHRLHLWILPLNMETNTLPAPKISINNVDIGSSRDYSISQDATIVIDVNAAIEKQAGQLRVFAKVQEVANRSIADLGQLDDSISKLEQIKMAMEAACPGGAHGIPSPLAPQMAIRVDAITKNLNEVKAIVAPLLNQYPSDANTRPDRG